MPQQHPSSSSAKRANNKGSGGGHRRHVDTQTVASANSLATLRPSDAEWAEAQAEEEAERRQQRLLAGGGRPSHSSPVTNASHGAAVDVHGSTLSTNALAVHDKATSHDDESINADESDDGAGIKKGEEGCLLAQNSSGGDASHRHRSNSTRSSKASRRLAPPQSCYERVYSPKVLLFFMSMTYFFAYFDHGAMTSLLTDVRTDKDIVASTAADGEAASHSLTESQGGFIVSSFMLGFLIGSPIFSALGRVVNARYLVGFGLLCLFTCSFLTGIAESYGFLIACRLMAGFGESAARGYLITMIDNIAPPKRRTLWIGSFLSMIPVGMAVGMAVSGTIATSDMSAFTSFFGQTDVASWRVVFFMVSVLALPFALVTIVYPSRYSATHIGRAKKGAGAEGPTPHGHCESDDEDIDDDDDEAFEDDAQRVDRIATRASYAVGVSGAVAGAVGEDVYDETSTDEEEDDSDGASSDDEGCGEDRNTEVTLNINGDPLAIDGGRLSRKQKRESNLLGGGADGGEAVGGANAASNNHCVVTSPLLKSNNKPKKRRTIRTIFSSNTAAPPGSDATAAQRDVMGAKDGPAAAAKGRKGGGKSRKASSNKKALGHAHPIDAIKSLVRTPVYVLLVLAMGTYMLFTGGASVVTIPMLRVGPWRLSQAKASVMLGVLLAVPGFIGTIVGGLVLDKIGGSKGALGIFRCCRHLAIMGCLGFPIALGVLYLYEVVPYALLVGLSSLCLISAIAPANAAMLSSVAPDMRTYAMSYAAMVERILAFPGATIVGLLADDFSHGCHAHTTVEVCLSGHGGNGTDPDDYFNATAAEEGIGGGAGAVRLSRSAQPFYISSDVMDWSWVMRRGAANNDDLLLAGNDTTTTTTTTTADNETTTPPTSYDLSTTTTTPLFTSTPAPTGGNSSTIVASPECVWLAGNNGGHGHCMAQFEGRDAAFVYKLGALLPISLWIAAAVVAYRHLLKERREEAEAKAREAKAAEDVTVVFRMGGGQVGPSASAGNDASNTSGASSGCVQPLAFPSVLSGSTLTSQSAGGSMVAVVGSPMPTRASVLGDTQSGGRRVVARSHSNIDDE